jgi:hypothetical protein
MTDPMAPQPAAPVEPPEDPADVACKLMEKEMEDQLVECDFAMHSRDAIDVACKMGPGIIEGPIVNEQTRRGWAQGEDGAYQLQYHEDPRPAFYWVDPWSFFPDPLARNILESEENYVRYLWTKRDLRKFAKRPDANQDAIRLIISAEPDTTTPQYLSRLQALTGSQADVVQKFYHVWKVSGPLSSEDMRDLAMAFGDEKTASLMDDVDPLEEVQAVLWFCQGHVLKFGIGALDSGECNYSIFNLEKDEASIWGYGVGRMIRDPQKGLNAAYRMVIDNAALATGDQIIINRAMIEPENGEWKQRARKVWTVSDAAANLDVDLRAAFANWSTECHVEELSAIMQLCYRQIDDATGMPTANEQQDPGTIPANTPVGTAILRTVAQNVIFKRIIKNWDDDITVPCLRRLYDWNMQFNPKEEIKGDYNIKPRGASTLLVREMQNQNLALVANMLGQSPVYGKYIKGVEVCRELILSLSLDPEKLIVSDEEAAAADEAEAAAMAAQAQGPAGPDPALEQAKIDQKRDEIDQKAAISSQENDAKLKVAKMTYDAKMADIAAMLNVSKEKLEADLAAHVEDSQQKDRSIAAEMAVRASEKEPLNKTQVANS